MWLAGSAIPKLSVAQDGGSRSGAGEPQPSGPLGLQAISEEGGETLGQATQRAHD
jgi:hypothetical protein